MKKFFFMALVTIFTTLLVGRTSVFAEDPKPCNEGKGDLCDRQYEIANKKIVADQAQADAKIKEAEASKAQADAKAKEAEADKAQADAKAKQAETDKSKAEADKAQADLAKDSLDKPVGVINALKATGGNGNSGEPSGGDPGSRVKEGDSINASLLTFQAIKQTSSGDRLEYSIKATKGDGLTLEMRYPDTWPDFSSGNGWPYWTSVPVAAIVGGTVWAGSYFANQTSQTQGVVVGISAGVSAALSLLISALTD